MISFVENGGVLGWRIGAHTEEQNVTRLRSIERRLTHVPPRGFEQRLRTMLLGPVRRVGGRNLWLSSVKRAPNAAH